MLRLIHLTLIQTLVHMLLHLVASAGCHGQQPDQPQQTISDEESHARMVVELANLRTTFAKVHPYVGSDKSKQLERDLATIQQQGDRVKEWVTLRELSEAKLHLGIEEEAIEYLKRATELLPSIIDRIGARGESETYYHLGVAYMRFGETQNCCKRHSPESCILPIRGEAIHTDKTGSTKAIECFEKVLEVAEEENAVTRESRWLLNLAYMTLGEYPDGVPDQYLIGQSNFQSSIQFPKFVNIASRVGLKTFDLSGGAIVDDFNGDNFLDVVCSSWDTNDHMRLFVNDGSGTFADTSEQAGFQKITGGLNLVQADYDNDGDTDVLVLRGAWLDAKGKHPNSLLQNNGDGTFTDVSFKVGLADEYHPTQTAAWADFDNDGDLDLYIGNEYTRNCPSSCQLFRNDGDQGFVDIATSAGVTNNRYTKGVVWGDFNNDRFQDIYVSNMMGGNRLYRNNKDGTFSDVAELLGVDNPQNSFPAWFFDYNNDGNLDIFVASFDGRTSQFAAHIANQTTKFETACLYRANGIGGFENVTQSAGLSQPMLTMGSNFGDLDGDGFLDFYLGTGDPSFSSLMPNLMFLNRGGMKFEDISFAGGFAHLQKGHGVAFADLDNDGDQDVFEQLGGAFLGDKYPNALFENPGFGNHWITILLQGEESNRSAIGARIRVVIDDNGNERSIYRHVCSGGSFGANPLRQYFGLGKATKILRVEVYWPKTNQTQTFENVSVDRMIRIQEKQDQFEMIEAKKFEFSRD